MTVHFLKLSDKFYEDVKNGKKTFEIRKNDREFAVKDKLILREVTSDGVYTGRLCARQVEYIIRHDDFSSGIPEGYVVMSIGPDTCWTTEEYKALQELSEAAGIENIWVALIAGQNVQFERMYRYFIVHATICEPDSDKIFKELEDEYAEYVYVIPLGPPVFEIVVQEENLAEVIDYLKGIDSIIEGVSCILEFEFPEELFQ